MRFFFKGLSFKKWQNQLFQKKKSFGRKSPKDWFLGFWWNFNLLICPLYSKMIRRNAIYHSSKTAFLGKIWFSSPLVLCFSSTNAVSQSECRSLWSTTSLGGVNRYLRFLHGHKGKVESGTTFFGSVWPVAPFIQANCRIIWSSISLERIIFILVFLYGVIHQGKVASETNTFDGIWL